MFYVGQKVVCVDASSPAGLKWWDGAPVEGSIYTVSEANIPGKYGPYTCLRFYDLARKSNLPYRDTRFRPAVSRSTDTGFAVLEDIRRRESFPAREPTRVPTGGGVT